MMKNLRRSVSSADVGPALREARYGSGIAQSRLVVGRAVEQGGVRFVSINDSPELVPFVVEERSVDHSRRSIDVDSVESQVYVLEGHGDHRFASAVEAAKVAQWRRMYEAFWADESVEGVVVRSVTGGMVMRFGELDAFLPNSQIDTRPPSNEQKAALIGTRQKVAVEHIDGRCAVVVSRRRLVAMEAERLRPRAFERLVEGEVIEGEVKNVVDYGAFVDCGGIDGLIHSSEISWERVANARDHFKVGQRVRAQIIRLNKSTLRVQLSTRTLMPDPWAKADHRYRAGQSVEGVIASVEDYGLFVRLEEGVEALAHSTSIHAKLLEKPLIEQFPPGSSIAVTVVSVDVVNRRISLSIP